MNKTLLVMDVPKRIFRSVFKKFRDIRCFAFSLVCWYHKKAVRTMLKTYVITHAVLYTVSCIMHEPLINATVLSGIMRESMARTPSTVVYHSFAMFSLPL